MSKFLLKVKRRICFIKRMTGLSNAQLSRAIGRNNSFISDILARNDHSDMGLHLALWLSETLCSPKMELSGAEDAPIPISLKAILKEV